MRNTGIFVAFALLVALSAFAQQAGKTAPPPATSKAAAPSTAKTAATSPAAKAAPKANTAAAKAAPKAAAPADAKPDAAADAGQKAIQTLKDQEKKRKQAVELTKEWFRRWNALDGKPESLNSLMELYRPDATQEVGPNDRQGSGAITYEGPKLIRRLAENFSKQWSAIHYLVANRTVKETTVELIQTGETPWGATQVAVEFTGGQTDSKKDKRYMLRGSAFFEIQDGKLRRVRVYTPKEEMLELTGPRTASM